MHQDLPLMYLVVNHLLFEMYLVIWIWSYKIWENNWRLLLLPCHWILMTRLFLLLIPLRFPNLGLLVWKVRMKANGGRSLINGRISPPVSGDIGPGFGQVLLHVSNARFLLNCRRLRNFGTRAVLFDLCQSYLLDVIYLAKLKVLFASTPAHYWYSLHLTFVTDNGLDNPLLWVLVSFCIDAQHITIVNFFSQQITIGISSPALSLHL